VGEREGAREGTWDALSMVPSIHAGPSIGRRDISRTWTWMGSATFFSQATKESGRARKSHDPCRPDGLARPGSGVPSLSNPPCHSAFVRPNGTGVDDGGDRGGLTSLVRAVRPSTSGPWSSASVHPSDPLGASLGPWIPTQVEPPGFLGYYVPQKSLLGREEPRGRLGPDWPVPE
jgi:hypothetical protein